MTFDLWQPTLILYPVFAMLVKAQKYESPLAGASSNVSSDGLRGQPRSIDNDVKAESPPLTLSGIEVEEPCACHVVAHEDADPESGGGPLDNGIAAQGEEDSAEQTGHVGFR